MKDVYYFNSQSKAIRESFAEEYPDKSSNEDGPLNEKPDLVFEAKGYSPLGNLSFAEVAKEAYKKRREGHHTILDLSRLLTEFQIENLIQNLKKSDLSSFSSLRVKDVGLFSYLHEKHFKNVDLHLVLEAANLNLLSLKSYAKMGSPLGRLVLSPLLSYTKLLSYAKALASFVDLEIFGFGPLCLFSSPRKLLNSSYQEDCYGHLDSLESEHKNLFTLQNETGTFIFYDKCFSLLNHKEELTRLEEAGVKYLRYDLRYLKFFQAREKERVRESEKTEVFTGFFFEENTDAGLSFLKNKNVGLKRERSFVGTVLDVVPLKSLGLCIENPLMTLNVGDTLEFHTPDGKLKTMQVSSLTDYEGKILVKAMFEDIVFLRYLSGVTPRTLVRKLDSKIFSP